jgi:hypothetical protein
MKILFSIICFAATIESLLPGNAAFAQRGHFSALIHDTPVDFVKKGSLQRVKDLGWTLLSDGPDSITFTVQGMRATYYFEQRGQNTLFSESLCAGDDCSESNKLYKDMAYTFQSAVEKVATAFEQAYKTVKAREKGAANVAVLQKPRIFVGGSKNQLNEEIQAAKAERSNIRIDSQIEGRIKSRVTAYSIAPVKRFGVDGTMLATINSGDTVTMAAWTATDMSFDDYKEVLRQLTEETFGPGEPTWQYETDHFSGWQGYRWSMGSLLTLLTYDKETKKLTYSTGLINSIQR